MTEPLEFQIMVALADRFRQMAVADGYYYGVDDDAVMLDPDNGVDALVQAGESLRKVRPFVIIEPLDGETWNYEPSNQLKFVMPIAVHWVHSAVPLEDAVTGVPRALSDLDRLRIYWRGCADIEKAINRSNDISLGGLAIDTRIVDRKWNQQVDGQDVWAQLTVHVTSRREFGKAA